MKLNEFVDRLYDMGDIETSTLNENWGDELDYYTDKVSADLYKYEGNKKFDKYVDKILSGARVSNIEDLEIKDLKKISRYADKLYGDTYEEEEDYYPEFFESLTEDIDEVPPNELYTRLKNAINSVLDDPSVQDDYDTQTIEELRYLLINKTLLPDFELYADFTLTEARNSENDEVNGIIKKSVKGNQHKRKNESLNESNFHDGSLRDEFYSLIEGMDPQEVISWLLSYINDYDLDDLIRDARKDI